MDGIVRYVKGPWLISSGIQNSWSVGQKGNAPKFSQFMAVPNISYNFPNGWSILSVPYITANFSVSGNEWYVPLGGGIAK